MTVIEAIERADNLRPNPFEEKQKVRWLSELDGKIAREVLKDKAFIGYDYSSDSEKTLIIPDEYADVYLFYLCSMIDFFSRDYAEYNNSVELYNKAFSGYLKAVQRKDVNTYKNETAEQHYKNIF